MAEDVRLILRRVDHHGLVLPGIHLNDALLSLAALAPDGTIPGEDPPGDD